MNFELAVAVTKIVSNGLVSMGSGAIVKGAADLAKPANVGKLRHLKNAGHKASVTAISSLVATHAVAHADKKIDEYADALRKGAELGAKYTTKLANAVEDAKSDKKSE